MKTIKEKAEECSLIEEGVDLKGVPYKDYNNYKMEGFVLGANYVLEQIESLTKYNRWSAQDLYNLIEQLKK